MAGLLRFDVAESAKVSSTGRERNSSANFSFCLRIQAALVTFPIYQALIGFLKTIAFGK